MELNDVLESLHFLEVLAKLDPVVLYDLVTKVIDDVLAVVQHALVEPIGMHVAG